MKKPTAINPCKVAIIQCMDVDVADSKFISSYLGEMPKAVGVKMDSQLIPT